MTGLLERPAAPALTLRAATPDDSTAVRGFLAGLSPDSAYRRFFTGLGSPSSALVRRLVEVDHDRRQAVLAVRHGEVIGLADASRLGDGVTVELGVVVADRWQRRGLGPRLTRSVLELAMARGARQVRIHALAENDRVARLVRRSWPDGVPTRDGPVLVWDLPLPVG
ncbi:MAG: GNAT family N-acetyltransferase [Mycobacteriales bacterium]